MAPSAAAVSAPFVTKAGPLALNLTDGSLLDGVKRLKNGKMTTESVVMRASSGTVRWVRGEHRQVFHGVVMRGLEPLRPLGQWLRILFQFRLSFQADAQCLRPSFQYAQHRLAVCAKPLERISPIYRGQKPCGDQSVLQHSTRAIECEKNRASRSRQSIICIEPRDC